MNKVWIHISSILLACCGLTWTAIAQDKQKATDEKGPRTILTPEKAIDQALQQLFRDYHEQYVILFPMEATSFGDMRFNDLMPIDISEDFLSKKKSFFEKTLTRLQSIDRSKANDSQRLAAAILEYELKIRLEGMTFHNERIPFHQFDGLHLTFGQLGSGSGSQPFKTVKDYENWLHRMDAFLIWSDVAIENFRQGIEQGYVLPSPLVTKMITQCLDPTLVTEKATDSLFYEPLRKFPAEVEDADRTRLTEEYTKAIETRIAPAYRRLGEFLKQEYLPAARTSDGIGALQQGREQYQYWVRYWTTTSMSPDEIFALGEKEVARIRKEMVKVQQQLGFRGTLAEFFQHLRTDQAYYPYSTPQEVLAEFRAIQGKIEPHLATLFSNQPKTPFEIRRTEAFRENTASAEYMPGTEDGTRPGIFYVPIPDASKFNVTSGMESLFLHEALPGHHYQISLQQENQDLPKFARFLWYGAYGEGWALYCETLGKDLGLYQDPRQYMGALNDDMLRAARLVVDVGLHWKGWTRSQAIEFMMQNQPMSEEATIAEIERYMAVPGQALSYKVGQQKMLAWRSQFQTKLGKRFTLSDFHHQLLKDGSMPLSLLEKRLELWAERLQR